MDAPAPPSEVSIPKPGFNTSKHFERMEQALEAQSINDLAFSGYLIVFGLATLVVLIALFWPMNRVLTLRGWRDRSEIKDDADWHAGRMTFGFTGLTILLILCSLSTQLKIDENRGFISEQPKRMRKQLREAEKRGQQAKDDIVQTHYLYLPQKKALRYLSLGNESVAADYMWLTSLQYVSSPFRQGHKFELLHRFYHTVMELDPNWVEAQVNAGKVLSALEPNRFLTDKFMQRAILLNPEDWRLPIEAGRLWVVPPGNPEMATEYARRSAMYFDLALAKKKNLPARLRPQLIDLIGRLNTEAGQHSAAAESLLRVAQDKNAPERMRLNSARQWLLPESLVRVDVLQQIVRDYRKLTNKWPSTITDAIPVVLRARTRRYPKWVTGAMPGDAAFDAYGLPITLDPKTGRVVSRGVQALRAIQKVSAMQLLVASFKGQAQRFPIDMRELTGFARMIYGPPNSPPFAVKDALGTDLDCEQNPLGTPWNYDPETGEFRMPDDCQTHVLYRNQNAAMEGWFPPFFGRRQNP